MRKSRSAAVAAASFLLMTGAAITAAPAAYAGTPGGTHASDRNADFNGDGYEDVLIGAPGGTIGGDAGAGYVTVQYGSSKGITTTNRAVFHQDTAGVPGAAEPGDAFGKFVASGDLDADGYDDAIVGIPGEDLGTTSNAGGIVILWGTSNGLSGYQSQWLESDTPVAGQNFGAGLAAAHFTSDTPGDWLAVLGRDDLFLYLFEPTAQPGTLSATGTATGARTVREKKMSLKEAGSASLTAESSTTTEPVDIAPKSLTTGDYDNNGYADLVVSGLSTGTEPGYGWSRVFTGQQYDVVYQRSLRGGPVVASGDLNGDGYDELVTGEPHSPDDGSSGTMKGGIVGVYKGSPDGLVGTQGVGTPPQWWTQDSPGVPGVSETGDGWGTDLSLGDTNGDGYADLAIGASGEDIGTVADAGAVWVLRGSTGGLTTTNVRDFNQDTAYVPGVPEKSDWFGGQVRLTDPNRDGRFGLLASAPGENTNDGVVWVLSAGSGGVTASGSWTYGGGTLGANGTDARFGAAIDE